MWDAWYDEHGYGVEGIHYGVIDPLRREQFFDAQEAALNADALAEEAAAEAVRVASDQLDDGPPAVEGALATSAADEAAALDGSIHGSVHGAIDEGGAPPLPLLRRQLTSEEEAQVRAEHERWRRISALVVLEDIPTSAPPLTREHSMPPLRHRSPPDLRRTKTC